MLELHNISLRITRGGENQTLLDEVTFSVPAGHLLAIVGPSGCGKTTLLKTIAGLKEEDTGEILWHGRNLAEDGDLHPSELGYVPQFSIAHDLLTVEECIASAIALRTQQPDAETTHELIDQMLHHTGLTPLADRQIKVLSGGQKRRLGLALELVTEPTLLLCDEVTSGLDPKSEREITQLLHDLAKKNDKRIVINVTHSLANLSLYDTILVMHEGRVIYHGPPRALTHYFSVESAEEIYPKLARRSAERWGDSWSRHREAYYQTYALVNTPGQKAKDGEPTPADGAKLVTDREPGKIKLPTPNTPPPTTLPETGSEEEESDNKSSKKSKEKDKDAIHPSRKKHHHIYEVDEAHQLPSAMAQTKELLYRRWTIFKRDRGQIWLQLAMLLGFPLLVVIFGFGGVKPLPQLTDRPDRNFGDEMRARQDHEAKQLKQGALVSGLALMQVVLVTLMASNNAAREIAGERDILERERLGGLRATSYVLSKVGYLGGFVIVQSLWMGIFVDVLCPGIPGSLLTRLLLLVLVTAAMAAVCLGISATMRTPEKATILSIYLVGFQLPLSGAVLALPKALEPIVQPFIAAYWGWSGMLDSMRSTAFYDAVRKVTDTNLQSWDTALIVLGLHVVVGLVITYVGVKHTQWD